MTACQSVRSEQHGGLDHFDRLRVADTCRVAENDPLLELGAEFRGDADAGEFPYPRGHPVNLLAGFHEFFHGGAALVHLLHRLGRYGGFRAVTGYRMDHFNGQVLTVYFYSHLVSPFEGFLLLIPASFRLFRLDCRKNRCRRRRAQVRAPRQSWKESFTPVEPECQESNLRSSVPMLSISSLHPGLRCRSGWKIGGRIRGGEEGAPSPQLRHQRF